jgi:hypothetical protein
MATKIIATSRNDIKSDLKLLISYAEELKDLLGYDDIQVSACIKADAIERLSKRIKTKVNQYTSKD